MRAIVVVVLLGLGVGAMVYQSYVSRIRHVQELIEVFQRSPRWNAPIRVIGAPIELELGVPENNDYSRYV